MDHKKVNYCQLGVGVLSCQSGIKLFSLSKTLYILNDSVLYYRTYSVYIISGMPVLHDVSLFEI